MSIAPNPRINRVQVRRAIDSRWPLTDLYLFPVTRRFHVDLNHNGVTDTILTTQTIVSGDAAIAVLKAAEILPDCDMPIDREPSDIPADVIEHVKRAALAV